MPNSKVRKTGANSSLKDGKRAGTASTDQPPESTIAPPGGPAAELSEKIKELIRLAQEQGHLTHADISDALPENELTPEKLDEVFAKLRAHEIEILDQSEVDNVRKPEVEEEEDDGEEKPEKKAKNPLDLLPPSKFNLFDFKTLYVNAPDKKEALKFFWENFDNEGYSIWFIKYIKAEGEGKVLFLTNNLMNGFLQRLDTFRKYAFGVHGVYGDEPNLEIRGFHCFFINFFNLFF